MGELNLNRRGLLGAMSLGTVGFTTGAAAVGLASCSQAQPAGFDAGAAKSAMDAAYAAYKDLNEGKNADYIPALAQVPSNYFGIGICGNDGKVQETGDSGQVFSMQSICKVYTAALVMQESGDQVIEDTVGVDATGMVFNSIVAVEEYRGKEMNPFVNPGAIATMGNVKGATPDEVWNKVLTFYSDCAGRQLEVNAEVYKSESDTNQRNRAIGALMSAYERFPMDPAVATDLYTRACSVNVSAKDLAVMGATLAFGGKNPVTGKQVLDSKHVAGLLAIMATAGMYDDSGKWLFHCGLPCKSGVGGGLVAVSPGKFGVGTFAPPLDAAGNSVRGQKAIIDITKALNANPYAQFG